MMVPSAERPRPRRMKKNNQSNRGLLSEPVAPGEDRVLWYDTAGKVQKARPDRALLTRNLHEAQRARTGPQYHGQSSFHGFYWNTQLEKHLWYESRLEESAMLWLDFRHDLVGFASQPMVLHFIDGTKHVPDLFGLHGDGHQVLYDVKPEIFVDASVRRQMDNTQRVCDLIGWQYELFSDIDLNIRRNLKFIAGYGSARYAPPVAARDSLLESFVTPKSYSEALRLPNFRSRADATFTICNMLWTRHLRFEMNRPLGEYTLIWKEPS